MSIKIIFHIKVFNHIKFVNRVLGKISQLKNSNYRHYVHPSEQDFTTLFLKIIRVNTHLFTWWEGDLMTS